MKNLLPLIAAAAFAAVAGADTLSPYTGQQTRTIKALSAQEIQDYLNGSGLGYAKAAELNHYPGPRHVLDLAGRLALSDDQTRRSQAIFDAMKTEASALGRQLVDKERELDRRFAEGTIDAASLKTLVAQIAALQADIRYAHLQAHLRQQAVLSRHQLHLYDQLRGYGSGHGHAH